MALCFSTSPRTLKVPPTDVYWLPDVQRNGHNFSGTLHVPTLRPGLSSVDVTWDQESLSEREGQQMQYRSEGTKAESFCFNKCEVRKCSNSGAIRAFLVGFPALSGRSRLEVDPSLLTLLRLLPSLGEPLLSGRLSEAWTSPDCEFSKVSNHVLRSKLPYPASKTL